MRCGCVRWGRLRMRCLRLGGSTEGACKRLMYATIDLHFSQPIIVHRLLTHLPAKTDAQEALAQTALAQIPNIAASTFYSRLTRSTAVVAFEEGAQLLQVHIEAVLARGSIRELKSA